MLVLVGKVVAAVLAAAAAVALGLHAAGVVALPAHGRVLAVVVSAVLAAASTVAAAVRDWQERRLGVRREQVLQVLDGVAWSVVDLLAAAGERGRLDVRDLGVAVYRLHRAWWAPGRLRLHRVVRVRARHRPTSSLLTWSPGRGVVGRCISERRTVALDLAALDRALATASREQWERMPDDVRLGLRFEEYLSVRGRYGVVVASPVIDDSHPTAQVAGCIALDGPGGCLDLLRRDDVVATLEQAGRTMLHLPGPA